MTNTDVYTEYDAARKQIIESWDEMNALQRSFAAHRLLEADVAMLAYDERIIYPAFSVDTMCIARITWDGSVYFIEITDAIMDTPLACFSVSAETEYWWIIDEVQNATRIVIAAYRLLADYKHATR